MVLNIRCPTSSSSYRLQEAEKMRIDDALLIIIILIIIAIALIIFALVVLDEAFNAASPPPARVFVSAAKKRVVVGKASDNKDKLLELLKKKQSFLPGKEVPSLQEACSQIFMKELTSILPKSSHPFDSAPNALRNYLLEKMGQRQLLLMHGKVQICEAVKNLLHCDLKCFDFIVCGPYRHPNDEFLEREVLETLLLKCSNLEMIVDERLDQHISNLVPVSQILQEALIQMKNLKSIKLTGHYYWTVGDVSTLAEALPKLEVLWLQLQKKPNLQLVDALSNLKCLKELCWSVRPRARRPGYLDEPLEADPNLVPALVRQLPHLILAGVAMTPDDHTWGHHGPLLYDHQVYPTIEHIKLGGKDFCCPQSDLIYKIAKVPYCFPNITSLSLQTKTGLTDYMPLLEKIGNQLKEFRHDSDDASAKAFPDSSSAVGALLQLAPQLDTLKLIGSLKYFGPVVPIMNAWLSKLTYFQMSYLDKSKSCHHQEIIQIIKYAPNLKSVVIEDEKLFASKEIEDLLKCLERSECLQKLECCVSRCGPNSINLWKHLIVFCPGLRILPRSLGKNPKMSKFFEEINVKICPFFVDEEELFYS